MLRFLARALVMSCAARAKHALTNGLFDAQRVLQGLNFDNTGPEIIPGQYDSFALARTGDSTGATLPTIERRCMYGSLDVAPPLLPHITAVYCPRFPAQLPGSQVWMCMFDNAVLRVIDHHCIVSRLPC